MRGDNALGHACGAGGEDNIKRRSAHKALLSLSEKLVRRGIVDDILHHNDGSAEIKSLSDIEVRLVYEHEISLDNAEDLIQARYGHIAVHRRIEAACSDCAEEACGRENVSARHNHYRRTGGNKTREVGADRTGELIKLTEGQRVLSVLISDFVAIFFHCGIKSAKYRSFHNTPFL